MNEKEKVLLKKLISEQVDNIVGTILVEEYEDPLAQVFLQPFKDVIDTARHGLEKTSAKVWGNAEKLAKQAATLLVPGLPIDAFTSEIDNEIKSRLGQIDSKYQSVIQRNYDMMRSRDLWGIPFLLNPALMTGVDMAAKAPEFVLSTLEAITGGNPTITKMRQRAETINKRVKGGGLGVASGAGWVGGDGGDGGMSFESRKRTGRALNEQEQQQQQQTPEQINQILAQQIEKAAQHPTIKNAMKNSKLVQQMKQIATESLLATVQDAINFNSYEEMKSKLSDSGKFAEAEKQMMSQLPEGATPEQIKQFQAALPAQVKSLIKQMYIKQLENLLSKSPDSKEILSSVAKQIQSL